MGEPNPARRLQILLAADQLTGQSWRSEFAVSWFIPSRLKTMLDTVPAEQQTSGFLGSVGRRLEETGGDGLAVMRSGCRKHPHSFFIHMRLATHLEQSKRGSLDEAIGTYRAAVAIRPECATAWISLSNALYKKEPASTEALACVQEAVRVQPKHVPAHNFLAIAYMRSNDVSAAEVECQKVLELDPASPLPYLTLATVYQVNKRPDDALAAMRRGVDLSPPNHVALANLAKTLADAKEYSLALIPARRVVELDPGNIEFKSNLWSWLQAVKDPTALDVLRDVVKLDPKQTWAWVELRGALEGRNDLAGAIEAQQQVVKLEPSVVAHYEALAELSLRAKQPAAAIAALEGAVQVQPDNFALQLRLGILCRENGKRERALEALRECIRIAPANRNGHSNLINVMLEMGRPADVLQQAEQTLGSFSDQSWAQRDVAMALAHSGRRQEAQAAFERALQLNPEDSGTHNDFGVMLREQGKTKEAIPRFEQAIKLNPNYAYAHANLGICFQALGQLPKSEEHLAIAVRLSSAPWISLAWQRTRTWRAIEPRLPKLKSGEEEPRDLEDALVVLDYSRQPFCGDQQFHVRACERAISLSKSPYYGGLRAEAAQAAIEYSRQLPADQQVAWRNKSLQFLTDDVQLAAGAEDATAIEHTLWNVNSWQFNAFFADFRKTLDQLPESERAAWQVAWTNFDKQLERLKDK